MHSIDRPLLNTLPAKMRLSCIIEKFTTTEAEGSAARLQSLKTGSAYDLLIGKLEQTRTQFTFGRKEDKFRKFYIMR